MRLTEASMKLGMAAVLGLAVAAGAVAQSAQQQLSSESVIETIKKRGALKVGMSTFVPWAMRDKKGELVGFEIDVAKKLAADMDVDIEFVPTAWDGIIPALLAGKFDVIIGGMSIRPQAQPHHQLHGAVRALGHGDRGQQGDDRGHEVAGRLQQL